VSSILRDVRIDNLSIRKLDLCYGSAGPSMVSGILQRQAALTAFGVQGLWCQG
jgi:hypothetical protein